MKKEELQKLFKEIGECSSIEDARSKIVDAQKEVEKDYDEHETILAERDSLKTDNENLRQANMKLFLQVGSKEDPEDKGKQDPADEDLKYENLFNDDGTIK